MIVIDVVVEDDTVTVVDHVFDVDPFLDDNESPAVPLDSFAQVGWPQT